MDDIWMANSSNKMMMMGSRLPSENPWIYHNPLATSTLSCDVSARTQPTQPGNANDEHVTATLENVKIEKKDSDTRRRHPRRHRGDDPSCYVCFVRRYAFSSAMHYVDVTLSDTRYVHRMSSIFVQLRTTEPITAIF
ncbi:unnamed protein product [Toxocara canis]|uniref:Uncharacterized protein n=1 Tax=Toxocara canis TaxID=6265 RepID=A0A183UR01_TOXCA|nr:unnamed protein product [Toxocara canis]